MIIEEIKAKKISDSLSRETIEVIVKSDVCIGIGSIGSGVSVGAHEAKPFPKQGVRFAVDFLTDLEELKGVEIKKFMDLEKIEEILKRYDSSKNWSKIGGNSVVALEFAILNCLRPTWKFLGNGEVKLPRPLGNCVGGGAHVRLKGKFPDIQEFLIVAPKTDTFFDANFSNKRIYDVVKKKLNSGKVDYEGALITNKSNLEILDILSGVVERMSLELGFEIQLGLDFAGSRLWDRMRYVYRNFSADVEKKILNREKQIDFVEKLVKDYNLYYVEDPLHENDFEGFKILKERLKEKCLVAGDDLICTNYERFKEHLNCVSAIIVKPNQIGSLLELKKVVDLAAKNKIKAVISHRAGETNDVTIAHLAVGWQLPLIKCGIKGRERKIKLTELEKIEEATSVRRIPEV